MAMVLTASFLSEHLQGHHAWKDNEATMVANVLLPILERLRPGPLDIRAECRVEINVGRQQLEIDTTQRTPFGRADFFLVDGGSGNVLVVVEAKPPAEELSDADRTQIGTYMGAVRPLVPFGVLTNGKTIEVHGWRDGTTEVVESEGTLDTSIGISLNEALRAQAARLLLRDSPLYRDQVLSQLSRDEIKHVLPASRAPRAIVSELASQVQGGKSGVVFVVSPPQCGRTQILVDLAAALPKAAPLAFAAINNSSGNELETLLARLDLGPSSGEHAVVEYLRDRGELSSLCLLLDCQAASSELHRVLDAIANTPRIATLAVVCAPYSVLRDLLFFPDFTPRSLQSRVTVFEMAGFADEELAAIFPTYEARLASEPVWRLLRWPGMHTVLRTESLAGLHLGDALGRWFRERPPLVRSALDALGRLLAGDEARSLERIPDALPEHLKRALLDAGLAVQVPIRAGFGYQLACIEVGMFALLGYVFDTSEGPRREVLTRIVDRSRPNSEAETVALMALLPYFLCEPQPAGQLERIVSRMVAIAFASYVLEGLDRSGMYRALKVDLAAIKPPESELLADHARPLYQALVRVREIVGVMPDFREVELMYGASFRRFGGRAVELAHLGLTPDDAADPRVLGRLTRTALLDALDLLATGDISWLVGAPGEDDILRVARAIAAAVGPTSRHGMPIESRLQYLNGVITRDGPNDIVGLLRREQYRGRSLSHTSHREALAVRTIEAYVSGQWEPLADAFCYLHAAGPWLRDMFVAALVASGDSLSFGSVLINGLMQDFESLDGTSRRLIGDRLARDLPVDLRLAAHITAEFLRTLGAADADVYARVAEAMRGTGDPIAHVRLLGLATPGEERVAELVKVVSALDLLALWSVLRTDEFWGILDSAPDLVDRLRTSADGGAEGAALALELLSLLTRYDEPVVQARKRPKEWPRVRGSLRTFLPRAQLPPSIDLGWDRKGCAACAGQIVASLLDEGPRALDRALRSALLNVHASVLAGELVHRATAPKHELAVSASVLRRLVLSGFDLWEVELPDPAAPTLRALITQQLQRRSNRDLGTLLKGFAEFVLGRWHRLRRLPNHHYTLRQIIDGYLGGMLFYLLEEELADGRGSQSAFWFLSDAQPFLTAAGSEGFAERIEQYLATAPDDRSGDAPGSDWKSLAAGLRGIPLVAPATTSATLDAAGLLSEVARVLESSPVLPSLPPAWDAKPHPRSMLGSFPGGFRKWDVAAFEESLSARMPG